MREAAFIKQNKAKWLEYELMLYPQKKSVVDADKKARLYLEIMDDLAYAQTNYSKSKITNYLNQLASHTYLSIYSTKKIEKGKRFYFLLVEVPQIAYEYRKTIYFTFALFFIIVALGVVSSANDHNFTRYVLGDAYVDMTISNIEDGDPVAVYKSGSNWGSFVGITFNNLFVGIKAFLYGIFLGIGTFYAMLKNALMLGTFQYFFYEKGVLLDSVKGIWIHGALEIFAMVIEMACGFILAQSILFPKSYSRIVSLRLGFEKAFKLLISTFMFTVMAGFLEGFVTRFSNVMPTWCCFLIILATLFLITYYYLIYPIKYHGRI